MRVGDKLAEVSRTCLAPKARNSTRALGQRPRIHGTQRKAPALKARFTSESFHSIIDAMPQSLSKVIVHIIFSTRDREPWLDSDVRPRMHAYLATLCRDLAAEVVRVGGVADHVHIVTTLPRTLSQAQLLSRVFLATRLWRVFGKPESTRGRSPLR
jgi:REP element-mobilizing transposase RayT